MKSTTLLSRARQGAFLLAFFLAGAAPLRAAAEGGIDSLMNRAQAAYLKGERAEGVKLANQAVAAEPKNPQCYYVRGRILAAEKDHAGALADFDAALKLEPRGAELYQVRGVEHFQLGHFAESVADFDKFIAIAPKQGPQHWQRGIALYYAGRYAEGRKQFESHQTVNPNDVENAAWHFLCVARAEGVETARAALMPIEGDARVPMKQIHALYAGKAKPEEVMEAARAGQPSAALLNQQLFYANLYVGLYYEAAGDAKKAGDHITRAAQSYIGDHYMGDVARVHAEVLRKRNLSDGKGK